MRQVTETFTVFTYETAPEELKQKILEKYWDINVDNAFWYEHIDEDLKEVGIKRIAFDTYRHSAEIELTEYPEDVARKIKAEWGESMDIYKICDTFLQAGSEDDDCVREFRRDLEHWSASMYVAEYEHATSEEAIVDTLVANEYEFTEDGNIYVG